MKINDITDHEEILFSNKRYTTIAKYLLKAVSKIRDDYYTAGKLPSENMINSIKEILDLFNYKVERTIRRKPTMSADDALVILKQIDAIMAEMNSILKEEKYS